ncbi:MAG: mechanosensitive ion channel family protein [Erysipelotrichaceae bacterium]|nr:mechanosensitive ion channel family protein [Erysipelotrichaceae bacterium]
MTDFNWTDIMEKLEKFSFLAIIIKIIFVLVAARLLLAILSRMTSRVIKRSEGISDDNRRKSIVTTMTLLRSVGRYAIYFVAICIIINELGYGSALSSIVTVAGVGALVISFGAQSIIKDLLAGVFITFERQYGVGDFVKINEFEGTVTSVAMRCTYLKNWKGEKIIIPNGQINTVVNYSDGFNMAIIDVPVAYEADIKKVVGILKEEAEKYRKDNADICIDEPSVLSINAFNDSSMSVRIIQKAKDRNHYQIQRDLRVAIKERFDKEGISIPYNQIVVRNE